jgi:sortase A
LFYFGARAFAFVEREEGIATFTRAQSFLAVPAAIRDAATSVPDQSQWSEGRRRHYAALLADERALPTMPAAVLRIRRIRLEVPVYSDMSERNLNRGAALVPGTASPNDDGNVAIAAHRDGFFRVLRDVAVGDIVEVESLSRRRAYRVDELLIVDPTDVSSLRETGQSVVTLITCYPFHFVGSAPQRFIVRAVAVD